MTTIIIPEIRHLKKHPNDSSKIPSVANKDIEKTALPPIQVSLDRIGYNGGLQATVEGVLTLDDPYYYALAAMPLIEERIKFKSLVTTTNQPIESLREWLRAVEDREWPENRELLEPEGLA